MLALSVKTYYYIINALCQDRLHGMNKSAQKMVRKGAFFAMTERNLTMLTDFYEFTMANGYLKSGIADTVTLKRVSATAAHTSICSSAVYRTAADMPSWQAWNS